MSNNTKVRTYTKEKVRICVDAKKGTILAYNKENPNEDFCMREFRGNGPVGYPCNVYSKKEEEKNFEEAYNSYLEMHPNLSEEEQKEALKRVNSNLSNSVLKALEDYDFVVVGVNGKYGDYIEAMVKPISKKEGENNKEFEKREISIRQNELNRAGIYITFVLSNNIFNVKTNIVDSIKVNKEAKKYRNYAIIEKGSKVYGRTKKTLTCNSNKLLDEV